MLNYKPKGLYRELTDLKLADARIDLFVKDFKKSSPAVRAYAKKRILRLLSSARGKR